MGVINGVAREPPRGIFLLGMGLFGGIVRWAGARVSYLESFFFFFFLKSYEFISYLTTGKLRHAP